MSSINRARAQAQRARNFEKSRQLEKGEETATAEEEVVIASEEATDEQNTQATDPPKEPVAAARKLKYPLTLSKNYPARIIFTAYKVEGLDIASKIGEFFEVEDGELKDALNAGESTTASVSDGVVESNAESDTARAEKEAKALLQSFDNGGPGLSQGSVTLPLPRDLRFSDNAQYETANLGTIGGALESGLAGQNPFAGATQNGQFSSTISALAAASIAKGTGDVAGAAIGAALARGPGAIIGAAVGSNSLEGLSPAVRSATRIATAPNQRTLFQQVAIRSFAFTFKMIANNADEAREIKDIVKFFRQEMYPEKILLGESGVPLGYKFPSVFEIQIVNKFEGDNPAFNIQRCYLRDIQTSFNSTASGMYEDGRFVEIDISLSFQEIVALDKKKIEEGY